TALDLGSGFAPAGAGEPMQANINISALTSGGTNAYTLTIQHSDSSGSGFTACSAAVSATGTGLVAIGCFPPKRHVRQHAADHLLRLPVAVHEQVAGNADCPRRHSLFANFWRTP